MKINTKMALIYSLVFLVVLLMNNIVGYVNMRSVMLDRINEQLDKVPEEAAVDIVCGKI